MVIDLDNFIGTNVLFTRIFLGDYRIGIYAKQTIFQGDELFFEYMYDAHHRQQFVNNERVDELEQDGLIILKRYGENFILVRPSYD